MARIYRKTDRIAVKIDGITIKLAPLSLDQKTDVQVAMIKGHKNTDIREATRGMALAIKYSVRGIEGVEDSDGNPYKLEFEDGNLSDSCVDDLMNLEITSKLALVCASMVNGIPAEFTNQNNAPLDGVELVTTDKGSEDSSSEKKN